MKYWLKSMVLILMMVFLTACGKNVGQQIEEQLQLGQKYLMEMKYDEAIAAFEKVISLEPKEFRGYEGLMTAYVETERKEDAERVVSDGLAVADTIGEWGEDLRAAFLYFVDYAVTYFQGEGQDDVVVALLERRLQLEESDETYRLLIGLYGKTEQLEKLYQLLGEYDGENEEILKDKEDLAFAETFVQELTDLCAAADIDSLVSIMGGEDYARLVDLISRLENPTFLLQGTPDWGFIQRDFIMAIMKGTHAVEMDFGCICRILLTITQKECGRTTNQMDIKSLWLIPGIMKAGWIQAHTAYIGEMWRMAFGMVR